MSIPKEEIEAIKQANDLISIIESKGIKLKKAGKNYVALCPFHEETTPSFTVDPVKQLWHCFGCPSNGQGSSGGDVISFIVKYDKITFQEAIERLKMKGPGRAKRIDKDTKASLPKQDEPRKDKPNQDKPKQDESKQDEPKQENPKQDKPKQDEPKKESLSPKQQKLLNRVIQYYQGTLLKETRAFEYLQKERGILNKQNILKKYLSLIKAIAFIHLYQREKKSLNHHGQIIDYIEVTLEDIEQANRIANEILGQSLDTISPPARNLLGLIHRMVKEKSGEDGSYAFRRREILEYTNWSDWQVKHYLKELEEMEYLYSKIGSKGKEYVYELNYNGQGQDGEKFFLGLTEVSDIKKRLPSDQLGGPKHLPGGEKSN